MKTKSAFAVLLQAHFTEHLIGQLNASPHTIASHRDTFRLLLKFAQRDLNKAPSVLDLCDLDAPFIGRFLDHLEKDRGNDPRTRNVRLAAVHSFFKYIAIREPAATAQAQRVLSIPCKRHKTKSVDFLTRPETEALVAAPTPHTWAGRRDHTLLLVAVQTGLRASELTGLRCRDVVFGIGAHVRCLGKGRRERCTPLRRDVVAALRRWLSERKGLPDDAVFPNARGTPMSLDGVEYLVAKHLATARKTCQSLANKRVSPHVLRHSAAMDLLQHGVDRSVIALWLGHQSIDTTQAYLHADLMQKERALSKMDPLAGSSGRYHPSDKLLEFLQSL